MWQQLSDEEIEAIRPLLIDARDMSSDDVAEIEQIYSRIFNYAWHLCCDALDRLLTDEEQQTLEASIVSYVNSNVTPRLRQKRIGWN